MLAPPSHGGQGPESESPVSRGTCRDSDAPRGGAAGPTSPFHGKHPVTTAAGAPGPPSDGATDRRPRPPSPGSRPRRPGPDTGSGRPTPPPRTPPPPTPPGSPPPGGPSPPPAQPRTQHPPPPPPPPRAPRHPA